MQALVRRILRARRPVHEPRGLVGRRVKVFDADALRDDARGRLIRLRCQRAAAGDDEAVARLIRRCAVRRVDGVARHAALLRDHRGEVDALRDVVRVEADELAQFDAVLLAAAALEVAAHKTALVLDAVPLRLLHHRVFRHRLVRPARRQQMILQEVLPARLDVAPAR